MAHRRRDPFFMPQPHAKNKYLDNVSKSKN
jgi:hypothetical protein